MVKIVFPDTFQKKGLGGLTAGHCVKLFLKEFNRTWNQEGTNSRAGPHGHREPSAASSNPEDLKQHVQFLPRAEKTRGQPGGRSKDKRCVRAERAPQPSAEVGIRSSPPNAEVWAGRAVGQGFTASTFWQHPGEHFSLCKCNSLVLRPVTLRLRVLLPQAQPHSPGRGTLPRARAASSARQAQPGSPGTRGCLQLRASRKVAQHAGGQYSFKRKTWDLSRKLN